MPLNILARGKGRIEISAVKRAYNPGDRVDVGVHLTTRKDIGPGRLFGSLICTERVENMGDWDEEGDIDSDVEEREIYRYEVDLAVETSFPAGTDQRMDFSIQIPVPPQSDTPLPGEGWLDVLSDFASVFAPSRKLIWKVECRYDIPRLDLYDSQKISVNSG